MYAIERHQEILSRAHADGRVEVKRLAEDLDVTPETVRRDLTTLERLGISYAELVERLEVEGVDKFEKSWKELGETVQGELDRARAGTGNQA